MTATAAHRGTRIQAYPFAYNTSGLTTGVTLFTPTVGDWILDAWVSVTAAFDGTTPKADFGTFVGGNLGVFAFISGDACGLDGGIDPAITGNAGLSFGESGSAAPNTSLAAGMIQQIKNVQPTFTPYRFLPVKVTAANPLLLVVSRDGRKGGTAIGGTTGAATLYLKTGRAG